MNKDFFPQHPAAAPTFLKYVKSKIIVCHYENNNYLCKFFISSQSKFY